MCSLAPVLDPYSRNWVWPFHLLKQGLMKKGGKETKGMKRTNRLHQTNCHLCDDGGSCGVNPAPGTPAERLFLFRKQEVPTGTISLCAFWRFHKSSSPWSEAVWLPWEPQSFVCSKFLTALFLEKSLKPERLNRLKKPSSHKVQMKKYINSYSLNYFGNLTKKI